MNGGRRRRALTAGSVAIVALALVAVGAAAWFPAGRPSAVGPPAPATTTITRGTLVEVTIASGALAFGPEQVAQSRLTGTVTALAPIGSTVDRGGSLFRIDDTPVVLMFGTLPAYRELTAGHTADPVTGGASSGPAGAAPPAAVPASKGADVRQFEENLSALGYTGFTVDDTYNQQTASAVRHWQKDLGLRQTGSIELGRVFYAPGAVRVATQQTAAGAVASGPVLTYTGTARLVTASIKEHDQNVAKPQTKVTVELPNGKEVAGTVRSVNPPAADQAGGGGGGQEPVLDVVVALDDQASVNGLDDGPARVTFVVQRKEDVLMVAVGALLALAEGGYGLQVIEGNSSYVVAVTTGLFANGNVEVSGSGIKAGLVVGMAR